MEIIINIPEDTYVATCNGSMLPSDVENVVNAIKGGTPLPKGHRRLISEEDMLAVIMFSKLFDTAKIREVKEVLLSIPTIIKADGGVDGEI